MLLQLWSGCRIHEGRQPPFSWTVNGLQKSHRFALTGKHTCSIPFYSFFLLSIVIHFRSWSGLPTRFAKQEHTRLFTQSSIAIFCLLFSRSLQDRNTLVYLLLRTSITPHSSRFTDATVICPLLSSRLFKTEILVHMVFRLLIYHPTFFYGSQMLYHRRSSRSTLHSLFKTFFGHAFARAADWTRLSLRILLGLIRTLCFKMYSGCRTHLSFYTFFYDRVHTAIAIRDYFQLATRSFLRFSKSPYYIISIGGGTLNYHLQRAYICLYYWYQECTNQCAKAKKESSAGGFLFYYRSRSRSRDDR